MRKSLRHTVNKIREEHLGIPLQEMIKQDRKQREIRELEMFLELYAHAHYDPDSWGDQD